MLTCPLIVNQHLGYRPINGISVFFIIARNLLYLFQQFITGWLGGRSRIRCMFNHCRRNVGSGLHCNYIVPAIPNLKYYLLSARNKGVFWRSFTTCHQPLLGFNIDIESSKGDLPCIRHIQHSASARIRNITKSLRCHIHCTSTGIRKSLFIWILSSPGTTSAPYCMYGNCTLLIMLRKIDMHPTSNFRHAIKTATLNCVCKKFPGRIILFIYVKLYTDPIS